MRDCERSPGPPLLQFVRRGWAPQAIHAYLIGSSLSHSGDDAAAFRHPSRRQNAGAAHAGSVAQIFRTRVVTRKRGRRTPYAEGLSTLHQAPERLRDTCAPVWTGRHAVIISPDNETKAPVLTLVKRGSGSRKFGTRLSPSSLRNWENEGGSHSGRPSAAPELVGSSPSTSPSTGDSGDVADMQARLNADFANGLVGQRFNTYEHRTRVIRQLRARATDKLNGTRCLFDPLGS